MIYVRVSTKEQTEHLNLPTQLRACEEYCRRQGYEILERFLEEGESAKTTDRSQLQKLLTFLRLDKGACTSLSARTMGVPGADRVLERPARAFGARSRTTRQANTRKNNC